MARIILMLLLCGLSFSLHSFESGEQPRPRGKVITLQSTVKGNREQPKVLYILPWQKADRVQLSYQPMRGVVDNVFNGVDRDELLRELNYRKQFAAPLTNKE